MESTRVVRRRDQQEGNILLQRTTGKNVQPGKIKTVSGDVRFTRGRSEGRRVDRDFVAALSMPIRRNTKGGRPEGVILPDGSVPVVHELIAVVLESPAEIVQHRPGDVTGRAA